MDTLNSSQVRDMSFFKFYIASRRPSKGPWNVLWLGQEIFDRVFEFPKEFVKCLHIEVCFTSG